MGRKPKTEQVKQLIDIGKEKGFLTYDQVNDVLPPKTVSPDQIDELMMMFGEMDIEIVDSNQKVKLQQRKAVKAPPAEGEATKDLYGKLNDPVRMYLKEMDYAIYNLSYISVPICFQFDSRIGYLLDNFDLSLGLSYSYNIYAKQEMFVETYHKLNYGPNNIRNEINHHEVGILSGIRFPFYKKRIYISFQYYWAITRLYRIRTIVYPDQLVNKEEFRNGSFNISFDVFLF